MIDDEEVSDEQHAANVAMLDQIRADLATCIRDLSREQSRELSESIINLAGFHRLPEHRRGFIMRLAHFGLLMAIQEACDLDDAIAAEGDA